MRRSSVAWLPRERMRDMTSLRFALVKTSGIGGRAVACGDFDAALVFVGGGDAEPVVDASPLRVAAVEFIVGKFTCVRSPPRFGGEAPEHARPAALGVIVAIGVQAGIDVGRRAPCADEIGFRELFELCGERPAKNELRTPSSGSA